MPPPLGGYWIFIRNGLLAIAGSAVSADTTLHWGQSYSYISWTAAEEIESSLPSWQRVTLGLPYITRLMEAQEGQRPLPWTWQSHLALGHLLWDLCPRRTANNMMRMLGSRCRRPYCL